jgi:uncharacterized protein RhaS with RHS repeats
MEGRFISKDPIGFDGGMNLYAYTSNNPLNYNDPTGLARCVYSISGGWLQCTPDLPGDPEIIIPVASGNNGHNSKCKNNPDCTGEKRTGPIPIGDWYWTTETTHKQNGRVLRPFWGTNVSEQRTDIRSHSCSNPFGTSEVPPFCSEGCVTGFPSSMQLLNRLLDAEPNSILHVIR